MSQEISVTYPDEHMIFDSIYLRYLLFEERDAEVLTYVEQFFKEPSHRHQINLMIKFPFFGNKILDNYSTSNDDKQNIFFDNLVHSDNNEGKIVLVDGAMGGGKTGFGCWAIDQYYERKPYLNYFFVTKSESLPKLPDWFKIVDSVGKVEDITVKTQKNSVALVDEGAIQLNSRRSGTKENVDASELLVKLRQKGITLIILVQDVNMVDVNVRRLASIRVLKYGIAFGVDQRQKGVKVDENLKLIRQRLKPKDKTEAYIEVISQAIYIKFHHGLPAWWDDDKVSKYMKNWNKQEESKEILVTCSGQRRKIKSAEDLFE